MKTHRQVCRYKSPTGERCREIAEASGLCYWHDPNKIKNQANDAKRLQKYAINGGLLQGISLRRANLENISLVKQYGDTGFDMSYADLYRANLANAHLYKINLHHADLMKADLHGANLHFANLDQANLLGVNWKAAKIDNIELGKELRQHTIANQSLARKEKETARDYFEQAEEVYRNLRRAAEREGLGDMSAHFTRLELTMRRKQLPKFSFARGISKLVDLICGYGEMPVRMIGFSLILIFICAICYCFTGLDFRGEIQVFNMANSIKDNALLFSNCLYYSVVTFTTLGYGDFTPVGLSRPLAAFEAFTGSFTLALFVVVFVKKMMR